MEYIMEKALSSASEMVHNDEIHYSFQKGLTDAEGIYECIVYENIDSHTGKGSESIAVSSFKVLPYIKSPTAYFFDWKVFEPGRGTGSRLFPVILDYLSSDYDKIKLQVSSDNTAAMKIYSQNQLEITETAT